ncbi:MAG TPA: hypothetical protein VHX60_09705 [Acidobacteriaceae bacterium]|jgi:hypothetical protein|nr:hypothetical protein [Acidobacteriaceae bacterium]
MRFFRHSLAAAALLLLTAAAQAQGALDPNDSVNGHEIYTSLGHRAPGQMDPADASLVQEAQSRISGEAAMFGYDLRSGAWSFDQILCPAMPGYVVLHYRNQPRRGAASMLTVLVPRRQGHVLAVPVRYGSATPYRSAAEASRTIAAFNRAVPAEVAHAAMNPQGDWLRFAMCYAAVAGADPRVPLRPGVDTKRLLGPKPTFQISLTGQANVLRFTDIDAPDHYEVWSIALNNTGRVLSAESIPRAAGIPALIPAAQPPAEHEIPSAPPPAMREIPSAPPPAEHPMPTATPQENPVSSY